MLENSANNKLIARNTTFLYVRMFIVLVISLYVTRVVFNSLGVVDFGIYNVVAGFVSLFSFLEATLSGSIQRFYNFLGTKEGEDGFNKVYSAGIKIAVYSSIALFVLFETFGIWYINNVMVIPEERLTSANIIFQFVVFSFVLMFVRMPYVGMIMAKEKMNFYAIVYIAEAVLKLVMALFLPWLPGDILVIYGLSMFLISLVTCLMMVIYAKRNFSFLRFSTHQDKDTFKSLLGFSGWNLVGTFAFMLKGEGLNLMLNSFFGPIVNAARGIAYQVSNAVSGFSANISMAFRPQVVNSYSKYEDERVLELFFSESKICFCLILVLIAPVIIEMDYILNLWLGEAVPENANVFAALILTDMLICTLNTPVTQVTFSTGEIKIYQIVSSCINLLLLPVCWFFLRIGFDATSVFVITIVISAINQACCLACMKRVFPFSIRTYMKSVIIPLANITIALPIIPLFIRYYMSSSFLRFLLISITDVVLAGLLIFGFVLNTVEKNFVRNFIYTKILKRDA